jgi:hypothetical protein
MVKAICAVALIVMLLSLAACIAISFRLVPLGSFSIGPFGGYSWNGGANIGLGRFTLGYHSGAFRFERSELPQPTEGAAALLGMAYPQPRYSLFYAGPFLITIRDRV